METVLIALIVAGVLASPLLWLLLPGIRKEKPPKLDPYTVRKLEERKYRHFDNDGWGHIQNPRYPRS